MRLAVIFLLAALAAAAPRKATSSNGKNTFKWKREGEKTTFIATGPDAKYDAWTLQHPAAVHVLDGRLAAVILFNEGDAMIALMAEKDAWAVDYGTVFQEKPQKKWARAWWVDEARGYAVVVHKDGRAREIRLTDGLPREAQPEAFLSAFTLKHARIRALEVAADLKPDGLARALDRLAGEKDVKVRVRVAIARGDAPVELFEEAFEAEKGRGARYLCAQAGALLGKQAIPFLTTAALRKDTSAAALEALAKLGGEAGPALAELVSHGEIDPKGRAYAAEQLGKLPPRAVVGEIVRQMKNADADAAGALLNAALATGAKDLHRTLQRRETELIGVLDKQTGPIGWLADHFKMSPTSEATKPLLRALQRHGRNPKLAPRIIGALKSCTGLDFGSDPAKWLEKTPTR